MDGFLVVLRNGLTASDIDAWRREAFQIEDDEEDEFNYVGLDELERVQRGLKSLTLLDVDERERKRKPRAEEDEFMVEEVLARGTHVASEEELFGREDRDSEDAAAGADRDENENELR